MKLFEKAYDCRTEGSSVKLEWFTKGKLNVSGKCATVHNYMQCRPKPDYCHCAVNCLDRHDGGKITLLWEPPNQEPEQLTYRSENECTT